MQIEWSEAEVLKLAGVGTEAEVEVVESVGRRIDGGKRWDTGREVDQTIPPDPRRSPPAIKLRSRRGERTERAGRTLLAQPRHIYITSRSSDTGGKPTSLLQSHKPCSGSAEAQLLMKQLRSEEHT